MSQSYKIEKAYNTKSLFKILERRSVKDKRGKLRTAYVCVAIGSGDRNSQRLQKALNRR